MKKSNKLMGVKAFKACITKGHYLLRFFPFNFRSFWCNLLTRSGNVANRRTFLYMQKRQAMCIHIIFLSWHLAYQIFKRQSQSLFLEVSLLDLLLP